MLGCVGCEPLKWTCGCDILIRESFVPTPSQSGFKSDRWMNPVKDGWGSSRRCSRQVHGYYSRDAGHPVVGGGDLPCIVDDSEWEWWTEGLHLYGKSLTLESEVREIQLHHKANRGESKGGFINKYTKYLQSSSCL